MTENDIGELASKYGTILSVKIVGKDNKNPCGFVVFATSEQAENCIHSLNGTPTGHGKDYVVRFAKAPDTKHHPCPNKRPARVLGNEGISPKFANLHMFLAEKYPPKEPHKLSPLQAVSPTAVPERARHGHQFAYDRSLHDQQHAHHQGYEQQQHHPRQELVRGPPGLHRGTTPPHYNDFAVPVAPGPLTRSFSRTQSGASYDQPIIVRGKVGGHNWGRLGTTDLQFGGRGLA